MNRNLPEDLQECIRSKFVRMDSRDLIGKTVARGMYDGENAGLVFTDGTWTAVWAEMDIEDATLNPNAIYNELCLYIMRAWGLITEDQFQAAQRYEDDRKRERKFEQLRRLQSELGELANAPEPRREP